MDPVAVDVRPLERVEVAGGGSTLMPRSRMPASSLRSISTPRPRPTSSAMPVVSVCLQRLILAPSAAMPTVAPSSQSSHSQTWAPVILTLPLILAPRGVAARTTTGASAEPARAATKLPL